LVAGVYRAASENSPVFEPDFFQKIENICGRASDTCLPLVVAGDFNAKIGSVDGAFGEVEEFEGLLPLAAESEDTNNAGAEMLSTFSSVDFHRLPFADGGVEKFTFLTPPTERHPRGGASIIDHVFFSHELLPALCETIAIASFGASSVRMEHGC
jgi:hypothetical protein